MKKTIKLMLLVVMLLQGMTMKADNDRVITFEQLPAKSQQFLKSHFAGRTPLVVTVDWDDYTIMYESGEKVEFRKNGEWKEIDCKVSAVPSILVPQQIKANVKASFPGTTIIKLSRDRRGYEVKLNNGIEIEYNKLFQVIDMDD